MIGWHSAARLRQAPYQPRRDRSRLQTSRLPFTGPDAEIWDCSAPECGTPGAWALLGALVLVAATRLEGWFVYFGPPLVSLGALALLYPSVMRERVSLLSSRWLVIRGVKGPSLRAGPERSLLVVAKGADLRKVLVGDPGLVDGLDDPGPLPGRHRLGDPGEPVSGGADGFLDVGVRGLRTLRGEIPRLGRQTFGDSPVERIQVR